MPSDTRSLVDRLLAAYERDGFLPPLSGGDHDSDDTDQTEDQREADDTTDADTAALGDAGKEALRKERERAKAAEKKARDSERELAALKAEQQKRKDTEAAEQGRWKELADQREADLATVTTERDTLQTRLDEALQALADDVTAQWKAIPDEVKDLYEGDDDDVLAKRKHLTKSAKLIARLTEAKTPPRGNGGDPKPGGKKTEVKSPLKRNQYM